MECIKKNDEDIIKKYSKGKFLGKVRFELIVKVLLKGWICKSVLVHKLRIQIDLCSKNNSKG